MAKDTKTAIEWYMKAAEQENAYAQYNLGECYRDGEGVEKDFKQDFEWFIKAVEQGNTPAQNNLGGCYPKGESVD